MKSRLHLILNGFLALLAAALFCAPVAYSAFDPVNDDTDIFLANPNIAAERPNVLIILDNTANWNNAFTNEKSALVSVINGLSDQFNVGLMMFPETGSGNDNVDGGYVRYHVRQMTNTNKVALSSIVNNLDKLGDKGNNATTGLAMYEAYLYYAGLASNASHGKAKTDHDGTADTVLSMLSGQHALPASPNASSLYRSPTVDGCQKNFIIYISNGPANENASARAFVQGKLATLTGTSPPLTIALTGNTGQQGNWADEMAKYMYGADVNATLTGAQNVVTYTVEVDPDTSGQGPDMTALLQSMAVNGGGKYFPVSSSASGTAIIDALTTIFSEVQAVNSLFAASSLPVSVNVRGAFLNQLYVGVFRPDAVKSPRWYGNLKLYAFKQDPATKDVFLVDATDTPAVNPTTGFIAPTAKSFWTTASSFWGFRTNEQNGPGGASDAPDGNIVEKGGVAEQLRIAYAAAESASPLRNVYTCTTGGSNYPDCVATSPLKDTPFNGLNDAITGAALNLDIRNVSPLTAFQSKAVTALIDRRLTMLTNAASPVGITLDNGGTSIAISSLKTSTPKAVTSLSALVPIGVTVSTIKVIKGKTFVTATGTLPSGFANTVSGSPTVTITGNSVAAYNNTAYNISNLSTSTNSFEINGRNNGDGTGGTASLSITATSTTATATVAGHGYASGDQITIAGATPNQFNGTFGITRLDDDRFTYTITTAAGAATGTITASGNTTTATAITTAAHGLSAGNTVRISGATPAGYNGTFTVVAGAGNTFTYTVAKLGDSTGTIYMSKNGGTTVTATSTTAHGFINGASVNIANSDISGLNGTFTISCTPTPNCTGATTFTYVTSTIQPANNSTTVSASTGFSAVVAATLPGHGFIVGDTVIIEGGTEALHRGTFTVAGVTTNQFAWVNSQSVAPSGTYTVRPPALSTKVFATVTAHGYTTGDQITIEGATPTGYNGTFTITVVDANTFTYPLSAPPGTNTGTSVIARVKTRSVVATSVAHGFTAGDSVSISGASPTDFNGTYTIAVPNANTFTYTLPMATAPQGDATGTIVASGAFTFGRGRLIRWVRGQDNFEDENVDGSTTDVRASVHGDALHSSPVVINYSRYIDPATSKPSNNDVYVFYGANDGLFRAVKGGYATDAAATVQIQPGNEAWSFVPTEFFSKLNRLRTNAPKISSSFKKPYFADGPISVYSNDANNNGKLGDSGDTVNLYISMRRGGRFMYALDVNDPHNPKYLWKIDTSDPSKGFKELGQTWSQPVVIAGSSTKPGLGGLTFPVLVFGGGYDPAVEDIDPSLITASSAASVTTGTGAGTVVTPRSMGRAIYVINALTGALVWRAIGATDATCASCVTTVASGMDYAIPSDLAVIRNQSGGPTNRAYVGDTGGNLWRIDFVKDSSETLAPSTVTKIAAVGAHTASGRRKFQFAPSVVNVNGIDTVLIGSGDREHPFDTTATNRFYAFKDLGTDLGPLTGTNVANPTIVESAMFDATNNCIQDAASCATGVTQADAKTALGNSSGWYLTLGTGEKVVGNPVTAANDVVFGTNQPSASAGGGTCGANLGVARLYQISATDATATKDLNASGTVTGGDRSRVQEGGGFIPNPDYRAIDLSSGPPCTGANCPSTPPPPNVVECVITGFKCTSPGGATLNARLRKYWFKEFD